MQSLPFRQMKTNIGSSSYKYDAFWWYEVPPSTTAVHRISQLLEPSILTSTQSECASQLPSLSSLSLSRPSRRPRPPRPSLRLVRLKLVPSKSPGPLPALCPKFLLLPPLSCRAPSPLWVSSYYFPPFFEIILWIFSSQVH